MRRCETSQFNRVAASFDRQPERLCVLLEVAEGLEELTEVSNESGVRGKGPWAQPPAPELRLPTMSRHDLAIAHATRRVKIIAKELKIPVILVFQLNRGSESNGAVRHPRPSDARDSGAIEQDLDAMFLLHRPSYYDKKAPKGMRLDLAIQRNGPTGLIYLHEELDKCRFAGGATEWTDAAPNTGDHDL